MMPRRRRRPKRAIMMCLTEEMQETEIKYDKRPTQSVDRHVQCAIICGESQQRGEYSNGIATLIDVLNKLHDEHQLFLQSGTGHVACDKANGR